MNRHEAEFELDMLLPYVNHLKETINSARRIERRKEGFPNMKDLEKKIQDEQEFIRPYTNIFRGMEVPMHELHPVFDAAIDAGIEGGKLGRKINTEGIVVVFQIQPPKKI